MVQAGPRTQLSIIFWQTHQRWKVSLTVSSCALYNYMCYRSFSILNSMQFDLLVSFSKGLQPFWRLLSRILSQFDSFVQTYLQTFCGRYLFIFYIILGRNGSKLQYNEETLEMLRQSCNMTHNWQSWNQFSALGLLSTIAWLLPCLAAYFLIPSNWC